MDYALTTERLVLRPATAGDHPVLLAHRDPAGTSRSALTGIARRRGPKEQAPGVAG